MDLIDASDYDFALPRRALKALTLGLAVGIAFVPSVRNWYLEQIQIHADHITIEFMSSFGDAPEQAPEGASPNGRPTS